MDDVVCKHGWSRRFCEPCSSAYIISQLKGPRHMGMLANLKAEHIPANAMYSAWRCLNAGMTLNDAIAECLREWAGASLVHTKEWDMHMLVLPVHGLSSGSGER